jgi:hypothetical protein
MAITRLGPNQDITAAKIAGTINFKNLIINGDMSLAQRGTSVSGLTNGSSQYLIDRFRWAEGGAPSAVFTMSQDTDVPTGQGFAKSLKLDCTTAQGSLAAGDRFGLDTKLEGQNLQFLKFGTANAESLTLSFWVKSNKTGTYNIWIYKPDGTARSFASNYTISSASTWEKKTINIPADTAASGVIDNNNGEGFRITWMLAAGSNFNSGTTPTSWENYTAANIGVNNVNFADDVANNFWLTGVQLEADTSASDFEFLPYDVNFKRCQRYFESSCAPLQNPSDGISSVGIIDQAGAHPIYQPMIFNTSKRAVPTMTYYNGSSGSTGTWRTNAGTDVSVSSYTIKIQGFTINCADLGAEGRSANGSWEADAEL